MASVPAVRQEGDFWQSLYTSGSLPERFRKYGMDNMGAMTYITRDYTRFASMVSQRFPKAKTVTDREHRVTELEEPPRLLTITHASNPGNNHTTFGVSNADAAQLQPNDILMVRGLYSYCQTTAMVAGQVNPTTNTVPAPNSPPHLGYTVGGQPTAVNYGRTWGEDANNQGFYFTDYEQIIVRNVGAANSQALGFTTITVERFFAGPGAQDFGGGRVPQGLVHAGVLANNAGALLVDDVVVRAMPSWPTGTGPARGYHKNPEIDNNFTQQFKYAVEIEKEYAINKTYLDKDPLDVNRLLRMKQMALDWERSLLFGRKGKGTDLEGKMQYTMGGILEFIKKDSDHILRHTAPQITYPSLLRTFDQVMKNGGSAEKIAVMGTTLYTNLKISFYDSPHLQYDEEASKEFDIPIEKIVAAGVKILVVPSQTFEETGYANKMMVLDMELPSFKPVTHTEWDMKIEKDIAAKGDQIYKEQWVGIKGLERRYQQYHSLISFE